jgi:LysM repeat protein
VADDRAPKPAPRPRRRRTDIDPNAPTPPVANERRRQRRPAAETDATSTASAASVPETTVNAIPAEPIEAGEPTPTHVGPTVGSGAASDGTQPFRVPRIDATVEPATPVESATPVEPASPVEVVAPVESDLPVESASTAAVATAATLAVDPGRAWLARLEDRSLDPNICPFLRSTADGKLISPIERPDADNRCAALNEAVPQSLRQQELVCLSSGHINCPRYLRGSATAIETPVPVIRAGRTLTTPIFVSLVILVMAVSASAAFVMARGGLVLSGDVASPSAAAVVPTASPSAVSPSVIVSASPSIAPTPSLAASATPTATPLPSDTPAPTATPRPTSDRYALLKPCPSTPNCWIYTVRSGDNVFSIARYFGVSMDSIYARNPTLKQTGLHAGQQLRLPPPTR